MDNRSHENAEWDDQLLRLEFGDLKLDDFDLALTGFVSEELDKLLGAEQIEGLTDPDEAPVPASRSASPAISGSWATTACLRRLHRDDGCGEADGRPAGGHGDARSAL